MYINDTTRYREHNLSLTCCSKICNYLLQRSRPFCSNVRLRRSRINRREGRLDIKPKNFFLFSRRRTVPFCSTPIYYFDTHHPVCTIISVKNARCCSCANWVSDLLSSFGRWSLLSLECHRLSCSATIAIVADTLSTNVAVYCA
jgi:hypothetical protein